MKTLAPIATATLLALFAAPALACVYDGNDAAFDACQDRDRQRSDEQHRQYLEDEREWREQKERREHWLRQEEQTDQIIQQLDRMRRGVGR